MAEQLYCTVVTDVGSAKIAQAIQSGDPYMIVNAAVGDGGGAYYMPTPNQIELRREVWRGQIAACEIDQNSPNMLNVKFIIPPDEGGWTVREACLLDIDGGMLAVCNLPDTQKAVYSVGTTGKLTIVMHIVVTDASVLQFEIHPELDSVSREEMDTAISRHDTSSTAHPDLLVQIDAKFYTKAETDELISGAAPNTHSHGSITNDGKIGTAANKAIYTGEEGALQAGILPVSAGGTGAATAEEARAGIGAASSTHAHGSITNDGKIGTDANKAVYTGEGGTLQAGALPIAAGGTGATTAEAARAGIGAASSTHSHGDITSDGKYAAPIADEATMLWCDTDGSIFPRANVETLNALGAQARVSRLTPAGGTAALTLADNTEYRFSSAVTSLTLTYPSGNFDSWVQFTAGDSITVTFPLSTTFIGKTPNFEASKTYEMSIKDGCVICSEVTSE